nr:immunoglobulin light chain junction region [Macaca mulatta]
CQQYNSLPYFF